MTQRNCGDATAKVVRDWTHSQQNSYLMTKRQWIKIKTILETTTINSSNPS